MFIFEKRFKIELWKELVWTFNGIILEKFDNLIEFKKKIIGTN